MQDILPPQKKPKKTLKIILIITASLFVVLLIAGGAYFLAKEKFQPKETKKTETNKPSEQKEEGEFVYVTSKAGLNMRSDASTSSSIIYTLPYRAKIKLEKKSQDNKWYKGTYDDKSGWFSADYIQKEEPEDLTADWQAYESSQYGYSLKYPADWQKKNTQDAITDFSIYSKAQNWVTVSVQIKDSTIEKEKTGLADAEHSIASDNLIVISSLAGRRYVVQKTKAGKVVSATDIILLEKDGKLFRIEGPADNEELGDIFNLLTWTIKFKVL